MNDNVNLDHAFDNTLCEATSCGVVVGCPKKEEEEQSPVAVIAGVAAAALLLLLVGAFCFYRRRKASMTDKAEEKSTERPPPPPAGSGREPLCTARRVTMPMYTYDNAFRRWLAKRAAQTVGKVPHEWRPKSLGVVALLCFVMQLIAVVPDGNHWATISDSIDEIRMRGEMPWDKIPWDEIPDTAFYLVKYDLWRAKEKFCRKRTVLGYQRDVTKIDCDPYTTVIKGGDGGRSCRGRGKQCEDTYAATSAARGTTCVALISAAIVTLGVLFIYIRARMIDRKFEASPKAVFVAAALLAVGGLVGLAGAANYRSTMAAAVDKGDQEKICDWGCSLSLSAGFFAMVVGAAVAVLVVRENGEELRQGAVAKKRQTSAKPSDSVKTPPTPPPDPETEPEAEAEEPGFVRKLSSFLFGEQEPVAESEGVVVEAEAMWEQEELEPEC